MFGHWSALQFCFTKCMCKYCVSIEVFKVLLVETLSIQVFTQFLSDQKWWSWGKIYPIPARWKCLPGKSFLEEWIHIASNRSHRAILLYPRMHWSASPLLVPGWGLLGLDSSASAKHVENFSLWLPQSQESSASFIIPALHFKKTWGTKCTLHMTQTCTQTQTLWDSDPPHTPKTQISTKVPTQKLICLQLTREETQRALLSQSRKEGEGIESLSFPGNVFPCEASQSVLLLASSGSQGCLQSILG